MMGRTHAISGVVAALAVVGFTAPGSEAAYLAPLVAATAAGAALLPDLDHPSSTVARTFGPITGLASRVVSALSGGHRQLTHSVLGVVVAVGVCAALVAAGGVALGVWASFLIATGLAGVRLRVARGWLTRAVVAVLAGAGLVTVAAAADSHAHLVTVGFAAGYVAHLLGDMLTKEGAPLLAPFTTYRMRLARLTTGHFVESAIVAPVLTLIAGWQLASLVGPTLMASLSPAILAALG
jgi:membrane-bound metal-dependent hydrolase YbcI (DUF457 family)